MANGCSQWREAICPLQTLFLCLSWRIVGNLRLFGLSRRILLKVWPLREEDA